MRRTTGFCGALLLAASPAVAAEEDIQLWVTGSLAGTLAQDLTGTLEVSGRARTAGDQLLTRASAEYKVSDRLSLGGAVAYVEFGGGNEFRLHQQAIVTAGPLSFRSRIEERWFAGADRVQLRLRQRAAATLPIAAATRAVLAGEMLYIAQPESRAGRERIEQWRAQVAVQHKLSAKLEGSVGYLMIYMPRPGAADRLSHVPQLGLSWRF